MSWNTFAWRYPLRYKSISRFFAVLVVCGLAACAAIAQQPLGAAPDVPMWQGDLRHTGLNSLETALTPGAIQAQGNFGLLFTQKLVGQSFSQLLFVSSATRASLTGSSFPNAQPGNVGVVYVATEDGWVYAFDAKMAHSFSAKSMDRASAYTSRRSMV
jgi:PQQ-like domain